MIDYRYALAAAIRVSPRGLIYGCMAEDQFVCRPFSDRCRQRKLIPKVRGLECAIYADKPAREQG